MILQQNDTTLIAEAMAAALAQLEAEEKVKFAPTTEGETAKIWTINNVGKYLSEQRQNGRKR